MPKNKSPLVSVVVPIYNTEKYLRNCLDSIIAQTNQNLEILLVDDGSTDSSGKICDDYASNAKKDKRIKVIHQKNTGLSSARNTGINHSSGEYLTFVDSDDYIATQMIEKMLQAINESHAEIAVCSFMETYPNDKTTHFNNHHYPRKLLSTKDALESMLSEKGFMVSATMKLYPRSFFKNVSFPICKLHEDVGTTYKLILQANKIIFLPEEYYYYCHHHDSIVSKFDEHKFDLISLTDQMCDEIDQHFPDLINITKERRMRARFSILRQIPTKHPKTKSLLDYLKTNRVFITQNPSATKADKLALRLALTNLKLFQQAYKLFK